MKTTAYLATVLGLAISFAAPARAGGFGVQISKHSRHGSFGLFWAPGHEPSHGSHGRTWVPGRYETVVQEVWVPGCTERVWVEAVYDVRYDCHGHAQRVCRRPGHWQTIERPGHMEKRYVKVWRPAHWRSC